MLFIPFRRWRKSIGGPTTFMRNLQFYLDDARHPYPYRSFYLWGDSIFFPIHFNPAKVRRIKNRGGKVIQRLDGCHLHPDGAEDVERNKRLSENYRHLADFIIFQSEYSKRLCAEILGDATVPSTIIHNGVHPHLFHPVAQPLAAVEPIEFVTTGRFRSPVMLQPMLTALDSLRNRFDFRLHICGPIEYDFAPPPPDFECCLAWRTRYATNSGLASPLSYLSVLSGQPAMP